MTHKTLRLVRRAAVCIIGTTVLLFGVVLLVLPGPALLVIPAGLAILAVEFAWARKWLRIVQAKAQKALGGSGRADNRESVHPRKAEREPRPKQR